MGLKKNGAIFQSLTLKNPSPELKASIIFPFLYATRSKWLLKWIHLGLFSSCNFPPGRIFRNKAPSLCWNYKGPSHLDAFPGHLMVFLILCGGFTARVPMLPYRHYQPLTLGLFQLPNLFCGIYSLKLIRPFGIFNINIKIYFAMEI